MTDTESLKEFSSDEMIGYHIQKKKSFLETVKSSETKVCQIFTGSTKSWKKATVSNIDLELTKEYITKNSIYLFIHSIYLINLSKSLPELDPKNPDDENGLVSLKWELRNGSKMGAKGVVVHVGKSVKLNKEEALYNMKMRIETLYPYIDPACPLLLETPAGQGTELLTNIVEFAKFYKELDENKVKICVDTCHVFAAGYSPLVYLKEIDKTFPNSIVLIHFNDSKNEKGSRLDRHEFPGKGHIGEKILKEIQNSFKEVPKVIEM